ncbi:huntingtin [Venturia canescens]|uniref:huntingtin n=1 Tax=Venturia canescens TaxID=32260 RepID=UPI001C9CF48E|nr:huntingtin [Venturia canescens]
MNITTMAQALNTAMKAVDAIRNFQQNTNSLTDHAARKAEKIACCTTIVENMCLPSVKTAPHFSQVLGLSISRLLELCDDSESDVRMLADECLNRIIRSMADSNIIKVQFALYNMINKNGSARSLRAALWRFAVLSHTIRPMKGKAYVSNLLPCIVAITQRSEDSVIDTLAQSLPLILKSLGPFMTDKDVKTLLKAFYPNLSSSQAVFRRNAASMILTTCLHCRIPRIFLNYVLRNLIDTLVPVSQTEDNTSLVIGVLGCLRIILPHIKAPPEGEVESETCQIDCLIQIYDLCLHYAKWHSNHNMVNAALETLAQLLQSPEEELVKILTSERGIPSSKIIAVENSTRISLGQMSSATTTISGDHTESRLTLFEPDTPEIEPKVEKWITDSTNNFSGHHQSQSDSPSMSCGVLEMSDNHSENQYSMSNRSIDSDLTDDTVDLETSVDRVIKLDQLNSRESEKIDEDPILHEELNFSDDSSLITVSNMPQERIDIGSYTDLEVPLIYACRYLTSSFLLTGIRGQLVPDKYFRVSVKSLALTCIGNILRLYPRVLSMTLAKDPTLDGNQQMIADVLLFSEHPDPQIRGNVTILIGLYLTAVYARCKGSYSNIEKSCDQRPGEKAVPLENLINLLIKGLEDDSTTACRQTLMALNICLTDILESEDNHLGVRAMKKLLRLVDNPYFLVKVQLAKVLSELPYIAVKHVTGNFDFQENAIKALLTLLADLDPRIRAAASGAIVRIIPSLYYQHPNENEVTRKASHYTDRYFSTIISDPLSSRTCQMEYKLMVETLNEPFYSFYVDTGKRDNREKLEDSLSIVINLLTEKLLVYTSKYFAYGCCEALSHLSQVYPTTLYPRAWDCFVAKLPVKKEAKISASSRTPEINQVTLTTNVLTPIGNGLLSLVTSMLSSSPVSLDLSIHRHLIILVGNVISGIALHALKPNSETNNEKNGNSNDVASLWHLFEDTATNRNLELLFTHVARLVNIYVHVIDGIQLVPPSAKSALPSLPSAQSLSPRKKVSSHEKLKERERGLGVLKTGKELTGNFFPMPHYMKLYETLKSAHANYTSTLDSEASKMYLALLNACLEVMSQILEIAGTPEASKHADEILHYLQTTLTLAPTTTVQCVRQLLKSLFGTNLNARWAEFEAGRNPQKNGDLRRDDARRGLYAQCFQKPARHMAETIKAMGNNCRGGNEPDAGWIGSMRRREDRKLSSVFKSFARVTNQKTSVTSFIKIFEPMVIKSLKQYTTTGAVEFQTQVLSLLTQLVQLHVNYCLLDTDKIFIGFVLDQFAFIDEAQIQNTDQLLPKIFSFLVHLSYKKFHSKNIIDVPKIIQLCDGLMASGQPPTSHCIPALIPTVEDIFLVRSSATTKNPTDQRELETTREVLMTTMLRLIEYPRVLDLLARCIAESRYEDDGNGEEKWRRWSRLSTDTILPLLASGKIRVERKHADSALMKLFAAVSPTVFRPVDPLLKVLFTVPPSIEEPLVRLKRWLGMVNLVLLTLIAYAKEETMLARLSDLSVYMTDLVHTLGLFDTIYSSADPLNATNVQSSPISPENIFAYFIFRVIDLVGGRIRCLLESVDYREKILTTDHFTFKTVIDSMQSSQPSGSTDEDTCLIHQFAFFLQLCVHMFESGSHCKIANASMQIIRKNETQNVPISRLNAMMIDVADTCPLLTCHWAYLMTLLDYSEVSFWSKILGIEETGWSSAFAENLENRSRIIAEGSKLKALGEANFNLGKNHENSESQKSSINRRIVREAGTILFCDHVCENLNDVEPLTWLLVNHIEETINLSNEPPVRDLVTAAVHRNPAASGLLVQAIAARCLDLTKPSFVKRLLQCMEGAHNCQSGAVIIALIPRFLETKHLALSRMAAKIASRRAEILLASSPADALEQLPRDDLLQVMETLHTTKLARKHGTLVSLMNKLAVAYYDLSPLELEHCRPFNPSTVKNIQLDRQWFYSQVKLRCCNPCASLDLPESAQLLSNLELEECDSILGAKEFDLKILTECVRLGVRMTREKFRENEIAANGRSTEPCPLYRSARRCILEKVRSMNELVPKPHQIYDPSSSENNGKIVKYTSRLSNLIDDTIYRETLFTLIPSVTNYVTSLHEMQKFSLDSSVEKYEEDLAKFALLTLETAHWMLELHEKSARMLKPHELELSLNCAEELLKNEGITRIFGSETRYSWICSASKTLTKLVNHWSIKSGTPLVAPDDQGLSEALGSEDTKYYARACLEMSGLVCWLENRREDSQSMPDFMLRTLKSLIISISRQPLVNTFVLTPPLAWKQGWTVTPSGTTKCNLPLLSIESNLLQEVDILQQFIFRVTLLGWTSRLQFEEMWMALLSVLSFSPNELDRSEDALQSLATSLAVQAITRLLMQTLLLPCPGNPGNSLPIHHPRDPQLALLKKSSQRLLVVQDILTTKYEFVSNAGKTRQDSARLEHLFDRGNIERNPNTREFTYSQLSIPYLWSVCALHEDKLSSSVISLKERRQRTLEISRLDVASCLRFLIELYTRWMMPGANTPPRLLNEVIKSLLSMSEIFVERAQFQWMLDTCLEISRTHIVENEILHHYLVVAICKSAAVLAPLDIETLEKVKRSIDLSLKSSFLPARITALHGMLYLLQSAILANCEETMNVVHPLAIKYIQKHIEVQEENGVLGQSEEHQRIMWALVFFLLEHAEDTPPEAEAPAVLELVLTLVTLPNISTDLHRTFLQGLERLIATRSVVGRVAEQIVKVTIERLRQASPLLALPALQLLLTCMYTESADRFNRPETEEPLPDIEPEALVRTIERTASIFDRIKRGYPTEVQVLCAVLSEVLGDFFPPSDILTKVIGEFLSPQQPHQRLLSAVVFKVCERVACNGTQLELLQDWIVFSLPNFIQSLPLAMSTWCLSCFFISASTNPWLRALFPLVQSRMGKYEYEDKKILCIAASDFYQRLSSEDQKKAFVEGFEAASKELGTPFSDILASF